MGTTREQFLEHLKNRAAAAGITSEQLAKSVLRRLTPPRANYDLGWCPKINPKAKRASERYRALKAQQREMYGC